MSSWWVFALGFFAQFLFSARMAYQWIASERSKKVVTPSVFWKISLLASFLFFIYGYLRTDFSIMLGQFITYFIYIRNLQLQGEWLKAPIWFRGLLWIFPLLISIYFFNNNTYDFHRLFSRENMPLWLLLMGSVAQVVFSLRFVYQWIYSERKKESSLPLGFWLISLFGSAVILIYGIFRTDWVLIAGQGMGSIIYARNIFLIKKSNEKA